MHDPTRIRLERIAPVHGAAIVPQEEIANAPDMLPSEFGAIHETPELTDQRLRFCKLEPDQISVAAAS